MSMNILSSCPTKVGSKKKKKKKRKEKRKKEMPSVPVSGSIL